MPVVTLSPSRLLLNLLLFAAVAAPAVLNPRTGARQPDFHIWAWQRNENLAFIDPATTGVALWLGTISVVDARATLTARHNPVMYPAGISLLAVIRLEIDAAYDDELAAQVARTIRGLVAPVQITELQLDFDARVSQRQLYRQILQALRDAMPGTRLSITALASWCLGDQWLDILPIDAAVPMLYRMGSDGARVRQYLSRERQFPATICRDDIGYSSDEPVLPVIGVKRIFWYHPHAWDADALGQAQDVVRALR